LQNKTIHLNRTVCRHFELQSFGKRHFAPLRHGYKTAAGYLLCSLLLTACATAPEPTARTPDLRPPKTLAPKSAASQPASATQPGRVATAREQTPSNEVMQLGTGELVKFSQRIGSDPKADDKSVSLNFENGDIREIAKNILGDLLQENFMIDPRVVGTVSIRTPKGVRRGDLIPMFETLLRSVNASLVKDGNMWRVLPSAESEKGIQSPRLGLSTNEGAAVQVLRVRHIGAKALRDVMLPFLKTPESVRADELRNILFLSGTESEIKRLLEISTMFDVDLLAGMSFLLYPLQNAEAKAVLADWDKVFPAGANPYTGLLRISAIERMNALLIVSPQAGIVTQAREMIDRLDKRADGGSQPQLYVYFLTNTQAAKIQPVLQQALSGTRTQTTSATVAPGQTPSNLSSPATPIPGGQNILPGNSSPINPQPAVPLRQAPVAVGSDGRPTAGGAGTGGGLSLARNAIIVADPDRNALLITATSAEYASIEAIIKKIDIAPKQVAIEVQIAQIALKDEFEFGLQSYFQGKLLDGQNRLTSADGRGSLVRGANGGGSSFTYIWRKTDAIQAILNLSESKNNVRTLAQPTMITLDNQKVTFNSGTQISVKTQTQAATNNTTAVDSFQYISTGISLTVTPRVSGDNVFLEIQQEISDAAVSQSGPNPDISKSSTSTAVMVQSGDTMLLGGLFQGKNTTGSAGLPFLSSIPVVGGIFGNQKWNSDRTELALLITPRIISDLDDGRAIVDELRQKLQSIEQFMPTAGTKLLPSSAADKSVLREGARTAVPGPEDELRREDRKFIKP
jgi:general secretion pathway protein D